MLIPKSIHIPPPIPRNDIFEKSARLALVRGLWALRPPPPSPTPIYINRNIYPLIYSPLPNSTWLHHTALRCVRRVQRGAYLWRKGLKSIKTGLKWAENTHSSCTPNGPGSLLEETCFSPIFHPFLFPKRPLFKAKPETKTRPNGLKMGSKHLSKHPKWLGITFGRTFFDPFLTHFWS